MPVLPVAVVLLSIGFGVYALEKELHLRKLVRLLSDERVLTTNLQDRLHEMSLLLEAGKAMNSVLELPAVLESILRSAMDLLSAQSGSIMVLDSPDELVAVIARGPGTAPGERVRMGAGTPGRVAATREPLRLEGRTAGPADAAADEVDPFSAICVPLVARNVLFGVLNVTAGSGRSYSDWDLKAASLFAEQAAGALANARRFETERRHQTDADTAARFVLSNEP
jgi:GAF domain-containing protein